MIVETHILLHDGLNWAKFAFCLSDVIGISESEEFSMIDLRGGIGAFTVKIKYDDILKKWQEYKSRKICLN